MQDRKDVSGATAALHLTGLPTNNITQFLQADKHWRTV